MSVPRWLRWLPSGKSRCLRGPNSRRSGGIRSGLLASRSIPRSAYGRNRRSGRLTGRSCWLLRKLLQNLCHCGIISNSTKWVLAKTPSSHVSLGIGSSCTPRILHLLGTTRSWDVILSTTGIDFSVASEREHTGVYELSVINLRWIGWVARASERIRETISLGGGGWGWLGRSRRSRSSRSVWSWSPERLRGNWSRVSISWWSLISWRGSNSRWGIASRGGNISRAINARGTILLITWGYGTRNNSLTRRGKGCSTARIGG